MIRSVLTRRTRMAVGLASVALVALQVGASADRAANEFDGVATVSTPQVDNSTTINTLGSYNDTAWRTMPSTNGLSYLNVTKSAVAGPGTLNVEHGVSLFAAEATGTLTGKYVYAVVITDVQHPLESQTILGRASIVAGTVEGAVLDAPSFTNMEDTFVVQESGTFGAETRSLSQTITEADAGTAVAK